MSELGPIRVQVIQGQPMVSKLLAARSLAAVLTSLLADIEQERVRRVETHDSWDGEKWLFFAFLWVNDPAVEDEEEIYDDTPQPNNFKGGNPYA